MRKISFKIDEVQSGIKIRDYLKNFGVSSALLTKLKKTENGITKNGEFARTIDTLAAGDILEINISEDCSKTPEPSFEKAVIIYEDEDILIADKPPFMPVHESRNHRGDALSNAVAAAVGKPLVFRAVYRLDRDTSGLVLIAKNELTAAKLAGKIQKDYYALVCGSFKGEGKIDAPIKRMGESIIKRCVDPCGEQAVTHYKSIDCKNGCSLMKINLETGRTHQIRVHFSSLGAPLLGDTLYGSESPFINRQALHCKTIYFTHPITGKDITIDSNFPEDFSKAAQKIFGTALGKS